MQQIKDLDDFSVTANNVNELIALQKQPDLSAIQARLLKGFNTAEKVTYMVSGDSTRGNANNQAMPYYAKQLSKIDTILFDNAQAGQSAKNWKDNVGAATLQMAIDATNGTGESTVMEYSYIINDSASTDDEIKSYIIDGITAYLIAKPDALVFLVTSVQTWQVERLENITLDVASTLNLPVISGVSAMAEIRGTGSNNYYHDNTHPNHYGMQRHTNYIFDRLLPYTLHAVMNIADDRAIGTPIETPSVETGSYVGATGATWDGATTWRRTALIPVDAGALISVDHGGDRNDSMQYDKHGLFIKTVFTAGDIPLENNTAFIAFNITSDGDVWDALGYVITINYENLASSYLTQSEVNVGNHIGLPLITNVMVDDNGLLGNAGQVKTMQSDGKLLWQ